MRWARFDDLQAGSALLCPPPYRVVAARRPDEVRDALRQVQAATDAGSWAYGYVAYEAAAGLDRQLTAIVTESEDLPLLWFGLCAEPTPTPVVRAPAGDAGRGWQWSADWTDAQHAAAVQLVREQIAAGSTYQVNLTDRLRARDVTGDLLEFYGRLSSAQAGAYNAYLDLGRHVVVSASPELFFEWSGDLVRTRPMKGTAARSSSIDEDRERARILRSSPKELAENVMIVDLLRNDLGRIARTGSVQVTELFTVESYPTVWQLVSEVTARISPAIGLVDLFEALFPCGSVTGAPKRRTMQLIQKLEPTARGVYCGAIGLLAPPSAPFRARFSVAIRTVVVDRETREAVYGVGGGITWGSDATAERAEIYAKAAVLGRGPAGSAPPSTAGG